MRVVGVAARHRQVFDRRLEHGVDPRVLAHEAGWVVLRPVEADLDENGELRLVLRVRHRRDADGHPRTRKPGRDRGLRAGTDEVPVVRQRFAAYAVVQSDRGLLATEYSDLTAVSGRWGMPGGGLDEGEDPVHAVVREVDEETGQSVEVGDLVLVQSSHWVGRSPHGGVEDFHAVRLIYRATCPEPTDPVVHDQGGTTASARWVPTETWQDLSWTANWRQALRRLLKG
ncbi:NUDIX hydrolase [Microlunatus flavus]|uniref:NUDIX domain-containing protein n=1 Tax=Microlunatus flavus TaxID=1036181 RepID=A0A1H9K7P4_9ACTN|nr:NUDIX domain-containing protein [Microlunatus flavus]SEQ94947.1 NUDIX domain-containing protein [Microlunatus flavus]